LHELTLESVYELGLQADIKKIACSSDEAKRFGQTRNAHDIAQWAGIEVDWDVVHQLAAQGWSQELDALLIPCKEKADAEGWLMTPVLLIDGQAVCTGYVPAKEYIKLLIQNFTKEF
jgi:hypothetical protein